MIDPSWPYGVLQRTTRVAVSVTKTKSCVMQNGSGVVKGFLAERSIVRTKLVFRLGYRVPNRYWVQFNSNPLIAKGFRSHSDHD